MIVYVVRGTTETPGLDGKAGGLLAGLEPFLAPGIELRDVAYPASIGPANPERNPLAGVSMDRSIEAGVEEIARLVALADEPVGLVGYSLGAMTISRYLERTVLGSFFTGYDPSGVAFVGLVANPVRAAGISFDGRAAGWGIAGQHGPWPDVPVFEIANPADVITACPANSPLRYLADSLTYASAQDLKLWKGDVLGRIRTGHWQVTGRWPTLQECSEAMAGLWGYLFGGEHVGWYAAPDETGSSALSRLAGLINGEAARVRRAS